MSPCLSVCLTAFSVTICKALIFRLSACCCPEFCLAYVRLYVRLYVSVSVYYFSFACYCLQFLKSTQDFVYIEGKQTLT